MNVFEALYTTRAMRRLHPRPIPPEEIAAIVDAAVRAPAGGGNLRVQFVAVTDDAKRQELAAMWSDAFAQRRADHFAPEITRLTDGGDYEAAAKLERLVASSQYLADNFGDVPLVLCAFGRPGDEASVFPAMWSACLAARALGIGSTFTRILVRDAREAVERALGANGTGWELQGILPMGHPIGNWGIAARGDTAAACFENTWGTPVSWKSPAERWWERSAHRQIVGSDEPRRPTPT